MAAESETEADEEPDEDGDEDDGTSRNGSGGLPRE